MRVVTRTLAGSIARPTLDDATPKRVATEARNCSRAAVSKESTEPAMVKATVTLGRSVPPGERGGSGGSGRADGGPGGGGTGDGGGEQTGATSKHDSGHDATRRLISSGVLTGA